MKQSDQVFHEIADANDGYEALMILDRWKSEIEKSAEERIQTLESAMQEFLRWCEGKEAFDYCHVTYEHFKKKFKQLLEKKK